MIRGYCNCGLRDKSKQIGRISVVHTECMVFAETATRGWAAEANKSLLLLLQFPQFILYNGNSFFQPVAK